MPSSALSSAENQVQKPCRSSALPSAPTKRPRAQSTASARVHVRSTPARPFGVGSTQGSRHIPPFPAAHVAGPQPVPVPLPALVLVVRVWVGGHVGRPGPALAPRLPRFLTFQPQRASHGQCVFKGQALFVLRCRGASAQPVPVPCLLYTSPSPRDRG